jgi:NTP pyrophosphatase (non-canonical NTP hydrolase)
MGELPGLAGREAMSMTIEEYARRAKTTAVYPDRGHFAGLAYVGLGLAGEGGEVANQIKKVLRDDATTRTPERKAAILDSCGDALWYIAGICDELKVPMEEVARANLEKLADRYGRDAIRGDGSR